MPPGITVLGLGPGDPGHLTREAWQVLSSTREIHLRTGGHPVVAHLPSGLRIETFDSLYETLPDFDRVYQAIFERLQALAARPEGVVYAVPGDPAVGEATVRNLIALAKETGLAVRLVHGLSFVEPCLALLGVDALDGLYVGDALEIGALNHPPFPPDAPALLGQLYSTLLASEVKLTLLNQYPEDHPVALVHHAGSSQASVEELALYQVDRNERIGDWTALFVYPLPEPASFEAFQNTVARLRAPDGCPWDREQTHASLRSHLLEEAYEALHAIDLGDWEALHEELGDLLLQIVLQAQIATEGGEFDTAGVISGINRKLIRRHPHVFGDSEAADAQEVLHNWEALKAAERTEEGAGRGALDGVPLSLPALAQAHELQGRAARVGFDWPTIDGVLEKIGEELQEVLSAGDPAEQASELGDLLFAVVNYARWLRVDPESALREANSRFRERFSLVEAHVDSQGRRLSDLSIDELDRLWEQAKGDDG